MSIVHDYRSGDVFRVSRKGNYHLLPDTVITSLIVNFIHGRSVTRRKHFALRKLWKLKGITARSRRIFLNVASKNAQGKHFLGSFEISLGAQDPADPSWLRHWSTIRSYRTQKLFTTKIPKKSCMICKIISAARYQTPQIRVNRFKHTTHDSRHEGILPWNICTDIVAPHDFFLVVF